MNKERTAMPPPPPSKRALTAAAAAALSLLAASCATFQDAEVKYTWDVSEEYRISEVTAGSNGVKIWYDNFYNPDNYAYGDRDATDTPKRNGGNPYVDGYIFVLEGSVDNRGVYYPISAGSYTAVCSVRDGYGYVDIVANYTIDAEAEVKMFYEVHFDVARAVKGDFDNSWRLDGSTGRLKAKGGAGAEAVPTPVPVGAYTYSGVDYHVFRRPAE